MEYQVKTAHGTLFCRREGSGPLLLLIHGVACDSEFFREASAILSKKFTVISYDRRGYSRSIPAEGETDFSVWAHADDAAEIIGARGLDARLVNLFDTHFAERFDTILMLMNGSGIIG